MPKMKKETPAASAATTKATNVTVVTEAPATTANGKKARGPRVDAGQMEFAIWLGGRAPKMFAKTQEELVEKLGKVDQAKLNKIVVYKRYPLTVTVNVGLPK